MPSIDPLIEKNDATLTNILNSEGNKTDISKIRKAQDDLLRMIFENEQEQDETTQGSATFALIISLVAALIIAAIVYIAVVYYFGDQLDNAILFGAMAVCALIAFVITFFLFKPKPVKKDKHCEV